MRALLALAGCTTPAPTPETAPVTHSWPNWRGPDCNGSAIDCGEPLVDDVTKARMAWYSTEMIPGSMKGSRGATAHASGPVKVVGGGVSDGNGVEGYRGIAFSGASIVCPVHPLDPM